MSTTSKETDKQRVGSNALLGEQTSFEIVQSAIDTANAYASGPHVHLRIVTLRMDDALRVLNALRPNTKLSGGEAVRCSALLGGD